jgi:hypothetical protein
MPELTRGEKSGRREEAHKQKTLSKTKAEMPRKRITRKSKLQNWTVPKQEEAVERKIVKM